MNFTNILVWYMIYAMLWTIILVIGMFIDPRILGIAGYGYIAIIFLAAFTELLREEK